MQRLPTWSRRSHVTLAAVLCVALAGCATGDAVSPAGIRSVDAPAAPRVGEAWNYRVTSGYSKEQLGVETLRVVASSPQHVEIDASGFREGHWIVTPDGGWLTHALADDRVETFTPPYPAIVFPLAKGRSWDLKVDGREVQLPKKHRVTVQGRVLGWNRVRVPAGEFDALRILRVTFGGNFEDREFGQSEITEELWYAPSIGRVVRSESRWQRRILYEIQRGPQQYMHSDWLIRELIDAPAAGKPGTGGG